MPRVAYSSPGATSMAFTPVPAYDGRGCGPWDNSSAVSGQPGTQGIPTGNPDFGTQGLTVNGHSVRGGGAGYAQGSGTMRSQVWYPAQYFLRRLCGATFTNPGQGLAVWSDNQMPVPAADPFGRAAVMAKPPRFLGQAQVASPSGLKGPARWADWLPTSDYGS
jgi:hypothetical protein